MCHVSMYNQILSSAAGPCGKLAKLALMRSLNNSNKDALSGNAGHGDADGITQPNKDARCTGTEDFFQSSSNFKSADAATLTEARALTALRAAREENTRNRAAVSQGVHCMHFRRITTQQSRTPPPPPDRPTDRSVVRSFAHPFVVRVASRRPRATRRPRAVDGRRCTHKNTPRLLARASRPSHHRARDERVFIPRVAPIAYLRRVSLPRPASVERRSVERRRRRRLASTAFHRPIPNARTPSSSHRASTYLAARAPSASRSARARILAK
mgnify:CR=1 FL=1